MKHYLLLLLIASPFFSLAQYQWGKDTDVHKWVYGIKVDKMTSDTEYVAVVKSKDTVDFGSFHKKKAPDIILLSDENSTSVSLETEGGFKTDENFKGIATIKIDNDKPFDAEYIARLGSTTAVFTDYNNLISKFRKAKVILVKISFTHVGEKVLEFDATPLSYAKFKNKGIPTSAVKWNYGKNADKMTSDSGHFAYCPSTEKVYLKSAGFKMVSAGLGILFARDTNILYFTISSGEYDLNNDGTLTARIRFDDSPPVTVNCHVAPHTPTQLFLDDVDELPGRLKKSKKVLIEIPFRLDGTEIIEFDTHGLVWKYTSTAANRTNEEKQAHTNQSKALSSKQNDSLSSIHSDVTMSHSTYQVSSNGQVYMVNMDYNNEIELETYQVLDNLKNSVTVVCKYKNKTNTTRSITIKADFLDDNGNVIATRKLDITNPPNSTNIENINVDNIGKAYKNYKVSIE